jgi:hypothetical protein
MSNGPRHYAADEIVAPELIALQALYDDLRGQQPMLAYDALPPVEALPGVADLALVEALADGRYRYLAMGNGYHHVAGEALKAGADGTVIETRPVVRQHFDLAVTERRPVHVSVTRWDGPKILQYDRLILPLLDGRGEIAHLLAGEVFLRYAKG